MNATTPSTALLTLYFDGQCAMCSAEIGRLRRWDRAGRLACVDITRPDFDPSPLGVDLAALNRELHGRTHAGALLTGIDTMIAAYTLAGHGWLAWPLRLRVLRPLLARGYLWFARHRHVISRCLGYRLPGACKGGEGGEGGEGGVCGVGNPFFK